MDTLYQNTYNDDIANLMNDDDYIRRGEEEEEEENILYDHNLDQFYRSDDDELEVINTKLQKSSLTEKEEEEEKKVEDSMPEQIIIANTRDDHILTMLRDLRTTLDNIQSYLYANNNNKSDRVVDENKLKRRKIIKYDDDDDNNDDNKTVKVGKLANNPYLYFIKNGNIKNFGRVVGKNGYMLNNLEKNYKVKISVPKADETLDFPYIIIQESHHYKTDVNTAIENIIHLLE